VFGMRARSSGRCAPQMKLWPSRGSQPCRGTAVQLAHRTRAAMRAAYGVTPAAVYELVHVCQARGVRLHIERRRENVGDAAAPPPRPRRPASGGLVPLLRRWPRVAHDTRTRCSRFHEGAEFPGQREFEQLLVNGIKSAMGLIPFCTALRE
jgi:hypothetical protein